MMQSITLTTLALISLVWAIPLKGLTLWLSAREGKKIWFIALLVIQTMGILELIYLLVYINTHNITVQKKQLNSKRKTKPKTKPKSKKTKK